MSTPSPVQPRTYWCFISYRHLDNKEIGRQWATWLHQAIETYEVPKDLVGKSNTRGEIIPEHIYPVFRDEEEIAASPQLSKSISEAIGHTKCLLVICSPRVLDSTYVTDEIILFKKQMPGNKDRIFAAIIAGDPAGPEVVNAHEPGIPYERRQCFPLPLRRLVDAEGRMTDEPAAPPLAPDFRLPDGSEGYTTHVAYREMLEACGMEPSLLEELVSKYQARLEQMKLKVIAGLLGVSYGDLSRRDKAHQLAKARRRQAIIVKVAVAFAVLALLATGLGFHALRKQGEAEEANEKTRIQLRETTRQLERSLFEEGKAWLERARTAEKDKEPLLAIMLAGRSVGFRGYGWKVEDTARFGGMFPALLSQPIQSDAKLEDERRMEVTEVQDLISRQHPVGLPVWSTPHHRHHNSSVTAVAFSPDGSRLASGSSDNTVKIWDAANGKLLQVLQGHSSSIVSVTFSPDGRRVASGSGDDTIKFWDTANGSELGRIDGKGSDVRSVAFSPDGGIVAAGLGSGLIKQWDVTSGREIGVFEGHTEIVSSVAFSPDGSRLASGSTDSSFKIWDVSSRRELEGGSKGKSWIESVSFSSDGSLLAVGQNDGTLDLRDGTRGEGFASLKGHSNAVNSTVFSPDGSHLASGSYDGTIRFWNAKDGKELFTLTENSAAVECLAFSPNGTRLASGDIDGIVTVWDTVERREEFQQPGHRSPVTCLAFAPDGCRIAAASEDKSLKIWDLADTREAVTFLGHSDQINSVAFSTDGTRIATGSWDTTIKLWDGEADKEPVTLRGHSDSVSCVTFSEDGTRLVSASFDDTFKVWDAATGKEIATHKLDPDSSGTVAINSDGSRLAVGFEDNTINIYDTTSGKRLTKLIGHAKPVDCMAISPDGTRLATTSIEKSIKLWDIPGGRELVNLQPASRSFNCLTFSPDGRRLASGVGSSIILWDATTGTELATFPGHLDSVRSLSFSPDGVHLASGSEDNSVRVWDTSGGMESIVLRGHSDLVWTAEFSTDDKLLVTGSSDHNAIVWDPATGEELALLKGHVDDVRSTAFNPDSTLLATGSADATVKLWDIASGGEVATLRGRHNDVVTELSFSPDGSELTSHSRDNVTHLWDVLTWNELPGQPDLPLPKEAANRKMLDTRFQENDVVVEFTGEFHLDLMRIQRESLFLLEGRDLTWETHDSLSCSRIFTSNFGRPHELSKLSNLDLTSSQRVQSRMQLLAKAGQWRAATTVWGNIPRPDEELRRTYLTLLLSQALRTAKHSSVDLLHELVTEIDRTLTTTSAKDPRVSLPLAQTLLLLPLKDSTPELLQQSESLLLSTLRLAPANVIDAVIPTAISKSWSPATEKSLRFFAAGHNGSPAFYRGVRRHVSFEEEIWKTAVERLLNHPQAAPTDYIDAAYKAAKAPGGADTAKELLHRAQARFPEDAYVSHMAGWTFINLHAPREALGSFRNAEKYLGAGEVPSVDLLLGLALAHWLEDAPDLAIACYKRAIETARSNSDSEDWAKASTIAAKDWPQSEAEPLEAIRSATLREHPALATPTGSKDAQPSE